MYVGRKIDRLLAAGAGQPGSPSIRSSAHPSSGRWGQVEFLMALGRAAWRREDMARAAELLSRASEQGERSGDYQIRVNSLLMLSSALVVIDRLDQALWLKSA